MWHGHFVFFRHVDPFQLHSNRYLLTMRCFVASVSYQIMYKSKVQFSSRTTKPVWAYFKNMGLGVLFQSYYIFGQLSNFRAKRYATLRHLKVSPKTSLVQKLTLVTKIRGLQPPTPLHLLVCLLAGSSFLLNWYSDPEHKTIVNSHCWTCASQ